MASRAARAKPNRETVDLKSDLDALARDVRAGSVDPKVGAVVNQVLNTKLRAIELERRVRETDELAAEISELKELYGA